MTEEDFEKEAEDIKELMMHFHLIRDRDEKRKLKKRFSISCINY